MTHASLFSGIGGAEVAAAWMGWRNVFHCEIQEFPRKVLDYWFPNAESYEDITKTDFTKWGAKSMFSQEASPASLSASQVEERERKTTATSGKRCIGQSERLTPLGSLVKMLLESQRWWSPAKRLTWVARPTFSSRTTFIERKAGSPLSASAKTSKPKDTKSSRLLYQLVPSEHPTEETGSGLLPTVQTQGLKRCNKEGKTEFYPTDMLPTPTAIDMGSGRTNKSASPGAAERPTLAKAARIGLLPTPMSSEISHTKRVQELKAAGASDFQSRANGAKRPNGLMDFLEFHELLPTPNAVEGTKYTHKYNPNSQMGRSLTALAVNGLIPTPAARDYKGNTITTTRRRKGQFTRWGEMLPDFITRLQEEQTGDSKASPQLNPLFVEEMMGFPFGWTTYPFLSENGDSKA